MKKKHKSSKIFYFIVIVLVVLIFGVYYFINSLNSNTRASENSFETVRVCYNEKCNVNNVCLMEFPAIVNSYSSLMRLAKDLSKDCRTCFYKCLSERDNNGNGGNRGGGGGGPPRKMFLAPTTTTSYSRYCDPVSKKCMGTTCTRTVNEYNSATTNCVTKQE